MTYAEHKQITPKLCLKVKMKLHLDIDVNLRHPVKGLVFPSDGFKTYHFSIRLTRTQSQLKMFSLIYQRLNWPPNLQTR